MSDDTMIRVERLYDSPPASVWRALTEPELHAKWWAAGDVRPIVGHRFELDMGKWGKQPCEVLAVTPERLFRYKFAKGSLDTVITWQLTPEGKGTRLVMTQEGFDLSSPMGRSALDGMRPGWPKLLDSLAKAIRTEIV